MNPGSDVAMGNNGGTFFGEHCVPGHMVKVIVSIHDEFDGELGEHANFAEKSLCGRRVFESVHYDDSVVTDDEAGVGAGLALGVVDGGVDVVSDRLQGKGEGSRG